MQSNRTFRPHSFSRSRPSSSGGSRRPGGFGSGRSSYSSRSRAPRRRGNTIDISKLINKAVVLETEEEYVANHKFSDFKIDDRLKKNIITKGFVTPTPIQDQTIPYIIEGRDVIGMADTGTGKTASFLLPLINKSLKNKSQKTLIVVPTRELALQIQDELISFTRGLGIFSVIIIGGASIGRQISQLRLHNHFIIGTPGRLKDLVNRKVLNLASCSNIVLDEVDRMLDMGFINDVRFLLEFIPKPRQSLFFSATMTKEIDLLIKTFMHDPVTVSLKTRDTASTVDQDIIRVVDRSKKLDILHDLLIKEEFHKILVFAKTKRSVHKLSADLHARGFKVDSIHGDKTQSRRQSALDNFKRGRIKVLVATDVAARGIDIADISHVINYDMPESYQDYIHRIGRTGRANKKGVALTFVD